MALLRTIPCLTSPTQLSTNSFEFEKKNYYSPNPNRLFSSSFHSPLRLSVTHTPTLIFRIKQHSNSTLSFSSSTSEQQQVVTDEELSTTRLLAQNVPWTSTTEDIRSLFEKHGKVLDVELSMFNKNRNRGLAFVEMGSPEEASAALNSLKSYEFDGRVINIKYARPKKEKTPPRPVERKPITYNLFIANFPYEARSKDLKEFFDSGTGKVVSAEVIFHENPRRPAGYGFVSFKSKKEADDALSQFQGKNFMGRPLRVAPSKRFVKLADESAGFEDKSSELSVNEAEADKAD